jgi:hypothetical protein
MQRAGEGVEEARGIFRKGSDALLAVVANQQVGPGCLKIYFGNCSNPAR